MTTLGVEKESKSHRRSLLQDLAYFSLDDRGLIVFALGRLAFARDVHGMVSFAEKRLRENKNRAPMTNFG